MSNRRQPPPPVCWPSGKTGGNVQAKPATQSRPAHPAPHVQAALAAGAQPKAAPGARPAPAAHVQAAVAQAKLQAPVPAKPIATVQARPAPVQKVSAPASAVPPPPIRWNSLFTTPAAPGVQAKASPAVPGVAQPAKRRLEPLEDEGLRPRRKQQKVDYSGEKYDKLIEKLEEEDTQHFEQKRQENLEKYKTHLSKKPPTKGSRKITYVRGNDTQKVNSLPISKDLMSKAYGEAMTEKLKPTFFHVNAPSEDGSLTQHFVVRRGHDYVLFPLKPTGKDKYTQEGKDGPAFADLALNAEAAAEWLRPKLKKNFRTLKRARVRVARDINRMAGGLQPRITYPLEYLAGADGLTTFAAVIRADKGRVSKATKYIESILKDGSESFSDRFGGEEPTYVGTGQGTGRGPSGLRDKAKKDPGSDSEYSSDDEK